MVEKALDLIRANPMPAALLGLVLFAFVLSVGMAGFAGRTRHRFH